MNADTIPNSVVELHFSHNQINAIERRFFDAMGELTLVSFEGNSCVDEKFVSFKNARGENLEKFESCFFETGSAGGKNAKIFLIIFSSIFVALY